MILSTKGVSNSHYIEYEKEFLCLFNNDKIVFRCIASYSHRKHFTPVLHRRSWQNQDVGSLIGTKVIGSLVFLMEKEYHSPSE